MATVITKQERERGCGFRKGGGIYLVSDGPGRSCGRMPLPLHVCPTCSQGIKPARGFTWIDSKPILTAAPPCRFHVEHHSMEVVDVVYEDGSRTMRVPGPLKVMPGPECHGCPMGNVPTEAESRVGLMWVGGKYYPSPTDFVREAKEMGLSKRIAQIPKELVVGQTWIWLAHRETIPAMHSDECITVRALSDYQFMVELRHAGQPIECDCDAAPTPGVFHAFVPTRVEYIVKGTETEDELDALERRGLTLVKVERIGENGELFTDTNAPEDDDGN